MDASSSNGKTEIVVSPILLKRLDNSLTHLVVLFVSILFLSSPAIETNSLSMEVVHGGLGACRNPQNFFLILKGDNQRGQ
jgi:hypothetical protein